jgi:hypothetical protein
MPAGAPLPGIHEATCYVSYRYRLPFLRLSTCGDEKAAVARPTHLWFYRLADNLDVASIRGAVPTGITVHGPGDAVELPAGTFLEPESYKANSVAELLSFNLVVPAKSKEAAVPDAAVAKPLMAANPLEQYSLRGRLAELEAAAVETRALLGNVALAGQATIIYAPPASGKTLLTLFMIMAAINAGRVQGGNVYYVNADDSSSGVAAKMRLLEEVGAHMLVPGNGLKREHVVIVLNSDTGNIPHRHRWWVDEHGVYTPLGAASVKGGS